MGKINLGDFNDVRHLLRSRLLSSEFHVIDDLVKIEVAGDLWKTFYVSLPAPDGAVASWNVTYALMDCWDGVTLDELEKVVSENERGSETLQKLSDILQMYLDTPPWEEPIPMYVISRHGEYCGAGAILEPTVQKKLNEIFDGNFYVILSSIHESIVVSADMDVNDLATMVKTINHNEVAEADRLSDHVYQAVDGRLFVAA